MVAELLQVRFLVLGSELQLHVQRLLLPEQTLFLESWLRLFVFCEISEVPRVILAWILLPSRESSF